MPSNIRVSCKTFGDCKHDFGLFHKELADYLVAVPKKTWIKYVDAREAHEMLYKELLSLKKIKLLKEAD